MRANSKTMFTTEKEDSFIMTETFTKGAGSTPRQMGTVSTYIMMDLDMRDNGKTTSNKERASKNGQMELNTKVHT